jgi:hypothetical protein
VHRFQAEELIRRKLTDCTNCWIRHVRSFAVSIVYLSYTDVTRSGKTTRFWSQFRGMLSDEYDEYNSVKKGPHFQSIWRKGGESVAEQDCIRLFSSELGTIFDRYVNLEP